MALKEVKIVFNKDYSPRKKGEVLIGKTHDEIRLCEWYLANQIADRCECKDDEPGCPGCADKKEAEIKVKAPAKPKTDKKEAD